MNQTKLTELVERATSATLKQPDTEVTHQIVEEVNTKPESAKTVAAAIKTRLLTNQPKVMFLSLGLLDFTMDKSTSKFYTHVGNNEFMQSLIQILNQKEMHVEIKNKIVYLIQKWGLRYEKQHDLVPLFYDVYKALLANGVKFPDPPAQSETKTGSSGGTEGKVAQPLKKDDGKVPQKYQKLLGDMNLVKGNINFTNEIIDGTKPGDKSNETLNDLFKTLTQMEPKLFGLIAQIENEDVMNACLLVNDDLQKTFKRYHAIRAGKKPGKFTPGESTQKTLIAPTHIYVEQEQTKDEMDQKKGFIQPKPQPQPHKEQIGDLFDFGPKPSQQQQQQPDMFRQEMPRQQQPQQKKDDPLSQLNEIMARLTLNPNPNQYQTVNTAQNQFMTAPQMNPAINPGIMGGQMFQGGMQQNAFMTNPAAMGMNPAAMGMMVPVMNPGGGLTYQNPNHNNVNSIYNNAGIPNKGPSQESWYKDGVDMGKKLGQQPKNQNDNIKEFQDLFQLGAKSLPKTASIHDSKGKFDFNYNPGSLPEQQMQQQQQLHQQQQQQQQQPSFSQQPNFAQQQQLPNFGQQQQQPQFAQQQQQQPQFTQQQQQQPQFTQQQQQTNFGQQQEAEQHVKPDQFNTFQRFEMEAEKTKNDIAQYQAEIMPQKQSEPDLFDFVSSTNNNAMPAMQQQQPAEHKDDVFDLFM